jgi:hypothetical protein
MIPLRSPCITLDTEIFDETVFLTMALREAGPHATQNREWLV